MMYYHLKFKNWEYLIENLTISKFVWTHIISIQIVFNPDISQFNIDANGYYFKSC